MLEIDLENERDKWQIINKKEFEWLSREIICTFFGDIFKINWQTLSPLNIQVPIIACLLEFFLLNLLFFRLNWLRILLTNIRCFSSSFNLWYVCMSWLLMLRWLNTHQIILLYLDDTRWICLVVFILLWSVGFHDLILRNLLFFSSRNNFIYIQKLEFRDAGSCWCHWLLICQTVSWRWTNSNADIQTGRTAPLLLLNLLYNVIFAHLLEALRRKHLLDLILVGKVSTEGNYRRILSIFRRFYHIYFPWLYHSSSLETSLLFTWEI